MADLTETERANRPHIENMDRLYAELQTRYPEYSRLRNPEPITLASLTARSGSDAKLLNEDEALILWMLAPGSRTGLVFAISKERSAWAHIGLPSDEIAARVRRLRAQIDPCAYGAERSTCLNDRPSFDRQASFELHQALLGQPEIAAVVNARSIRSLLIVPSGVLSTLPPAVLITAPPFGGKELDSSPQGWSSSAWLILKRAITVMPAVSTLSALRGPAATVRQGTVTRGASEDGLFMMADPDFAGSGQRSAVCQVDQPRSVAKPAGRYLRGSAFDRQALAALAPLPCTRIEGERLLKQLGGSVLFGRDAREAQLRNRDQAGRLSRARVVAFATHGLVSGDLGLGEPGLALAAPGPGDGADDGVLTASEIVGLKLSADFVLLSACNTASPDAGDAQGLSGLAKAFFRAGAQGVLVSHWRVDDAATSALVSEAMALRQAGKNKAEALQLASIAMMQGKIGGSDEAARDRAPHPSIWAPFTLIGEPR